MSRSEVTKTIFELLTNPEKFPKAKLDVQEYLKKISGEFGRKIYHPMDLYEISDENIKKFLYKEIKFHANQSFVTDFTSSLGGPITSVAIGVPASIIMYLRNILLISQKVAIATGIAPNPLKPGITYEISLKESYIDFLELMAYGIGAGGTRELTKIIAQKFAEKKAKDIIRKRIQDELITKLAKKIAEVLGVKLTKSTISRTVLRTLPVVGGGISGVIGYKSITSFGERTLIRAFEIRNSLRDEILKRKQEQELKIKVSNVLPKLKLLYERGVIDSLNKEDLAKLLETDPIIVDKAIKELRED